MGEKWIDNWDNSTRHTQYAADIAGYILLKLGGSVDSLKLMSLMYLAERESLLQCGHTMTHGEVFVSTPEGIALKHVYRLMLKGKGSPSPWCFVIRNEDGMHSLINKDHWFGWMSQFKEQIVETIVDRYGSWTGKKLSKYIRENCKEWKPTKDYHLPITVFNIFKALGFSDEDARQSQKFMNEMNAMDDGWGIGWWKSE